MQNPCKECIVRPICIERFHRVTYILLNDNITKDEEIPQDIVDRQRNFYNLYTDCKLLKNYVHYIFSRSNISIIEDTNPHVHSSSGMGNKIYTGIITHWPLFEPIFQRGGNEGSM